MSKKNKKSGKKKAYSVDDILSEYDKKSGGPENEDNTDNPDVISTDDFPEDEPEELAPASFSAAEAYSVDSADKSAEELFASEEDEKQPDVFVKAEFPDEETENHWQESGEAASQIIDEGAFKEELEEDVVSEEEKAEEKSAAEETGEADIIEADEEEEADSDKDNIPPDNDAAEEKSPAVTDDDKAAREEKTEAAESSEKDESPDGKSEPDEKKSFWQGIIPWKGDSVFEIIRKIIFISAVTVFIGAGVMLASTLVQSRKAVQDAQEIKDFVTTTVATMIGDDGSVITIAPTDEEKEQHNIDVLNKYKAISEDVIGFIELEGCDIYYPVVQAEDNDYYLTRTYYGDNNKGGAIYADFRCVFKEDYTSPNIVIYGHNQEDGTMFGNLKNYKQNLEFYAKNPAVTFNTEYGLGTYLIYGFFVTNALEKQDSNGEVFHYHDYIETMNNESTFNWYMKEVQRRNQIISPVDVEYGDKLLCLSTCSDEFSNSRFVVFARKLRDGESVSDYDFSETRFNPDAKGVDWTAILSGETTAPEETTRKKKTNLAQTSAEETEEETTKKKKKTTAAVSEDAPDEPDTPAVTEVPETATEAPATETGGVT